MSLSNHSSPRQSRNNSDARPPASVIAGSAATSAAKSSSSSSSSKNCANHSSAEDIIARGRRLSNSSAANARQRMAVGPPEHKFSPSSPSTAEIIDQFEKEQEAMVNKLQREITTLKSERSRSRSHSSSSSRSFQMPRSMSYSDNEDRPRHASGHVGEDALAALRRENEALRKRIAELSIKLSEKEHEVDVMKKRSSSISSESSVQAVPALQAAKPSDSEKLPQQSRKEDH